MLSEAAVCAPGRLMPSGRGEAALKRQASSRRRIASSGSRWQTMPRSAISFHRRGSSRLFKIYASPPFRDSLCPQSSYDIMPKQTSRPPSCHVAADSLQSLCSGLYLRVDVDRYFRRFTAAVLFQAAATEVPAPDIMKES